VIRNLSRTISVLIAMTVLVTWLALTILSTILLIRVWPSPIGTGVSLVFLFLAFGSRPRFSKPPEGELLRRTDTPELFRLVDEIGEHLNSPTIELIVIDGHTNAWTARFGVRRRLTIGVGLPLWEALTPDERVAILAHEVSHNVNGDIRRGFIVGNSLHTLSTWVTILQPTTHTATGVSFSLAWALQWVLVSPVLGTYLLLRRLTLTSSRRAELESDRLGASVAGTDASLAALDKLIFAPAIDRAIAGAVSRGDDLWEAVRTRLREIPEADRSAIREESRKVLAGVDDTHPPTHLRISALTNEPKSSPMIYLDQGWNDSVDLELDSVRAQVERRIRNPGD